MLALIRQASLYMLIVGDWRITNGKSCCRNVHHTEIGIYFINGQYGFFLFQYQTYSLTHSHAEMAHQSLCGEYLNLSNVKIPVWILFLLSDVLFYIFPRRNGFNSPSVTVRRIFEFVLCPINLCLVLNECNLNGGCTTCASIRCTCQIFTGLNVPCLLYYTIHIANYLF